MRSLARQRMWLFIALPAVFAAAYLYVYRPGGGLGWYPQCVFKRMTGWECPGCGGLRAAHEMLHLHFKAAFHYNSLVFVLSPFLLYLVYASTSREVFGRPLPPRFTWKGWPFVLLALVIGFTIARNLPWLNN